MTLTDVANNVRIICPDCKKEKMCSIPKSAINESSSINTISIPKNLICNHHFQAFVDNNFKVRGYQKVDFEIPREINEDFKEKEPIVQSHALPIKRPSPVLPKRTFPSDEELLKAIIYQGNTVQFTPNDIKAAKTESRRNSQQELREIYEEFREFISDDNLLFQEFIKQDQKGREGRKK